VPEVEPTVDEDDEDPESLIITGPRRTRRTINYASVRSSTCSGTDEQKEAMDKAGIDANAVDSDDEDGEANPESPDDDGGLFQRATLTYQKPDPTMTMMRRSKHRMPKHADQRVNIVLYRVWPLCMHAILYNPPDAYKLSPSLEPSLWLYTDIRLRASSSLVRKYDNSLCNLGC
jgi:hypothetical protein